jgi:hypothetical protein
MRWEAWEPPPPPRRPGTRLPNAALAAPAAAAATWNSWTRLGFSAMTLLTSLTTSTTASPSRLFRVMAKARPMKKACSTWPASAAGGAGCSSEARGSRLLQPRSCSIPACLGRWRRGRPAPRAGAPLACCLPAAPGAVAAAGRGPPSGVAGGAAASLSACCDGAMRCGAGARERRETKRERCSVQTAEVQDDEQVVPERQRIDAAPARVLMML